MFVSPLALRWDELIQSRTSHRKTDRDTTNRMFTGESRPAHQVSLKRPSSAALTPALPIQPSFPLQGAASLSEKRSGISRPSSQEFIIIRTEFSRQRAGRVLAESMKRKLRAQHAKTCRAWQLCSRLHSPRNLSADN